jgi:hypothetical protein
MLKSGEDEKRSVRLQLAKSLEEIAPERIILNSKFSILNSCGVTACLPSLAEG